MEDQYNMVDRANVYNDDEFDVFCRSSVDHKKIHKGKKLRHMQPYVADQETAAKVCYFVKFVWWSEKVKK